MSWVGDDGLESASVSSSGDDDIIELDATSHPTYLPNLRSSRRLAQSSHTQRPQRPQRPSGLILPVPATAAGSHLEQAERATDELLRTTRLQRHLQEVRQQHQEEQRQRPRRRHSHSQHTQGEAAAQVIDLTEEPDSPTRQESPQAQRANRHARNPRRTSSQRVSPPRLSRSDSTTIMGQNAGIIDLTADSPEDERRPTLESWRTRHRRRNESQIPTDQLIQLELFRQESNVNFARRMATMFGGEFVRTLHHVNTRYMPPARPPSPKPPMEPAPPTRDGYTRDTHANPDEEIVVICPCCNEELAYDPSDAAAVQNIGVKKRKRALAEHHFWALKKCGHVYCADCFENRRPSKTCPAGAGFRLPPGKASPPNPNEIRCVVEGCESKAAAKTEWVGIFL